MAEFGVVFANERHADGTVDPNGTNITYRTVSAAGALAAPIAIADFNGGSGQDALRAPAIATLQSGRQIVVFERVVSGTNFDVFLNVVNAAGTATEFSAASPLAVASTKPNRATDPVVAANGENALIVYEKALPDRPMRRASTCVRSTAKPTRWESGCVAIDLRYRRRVTPSL